MKHPTSEEFLITSGLKGFEQVSKYIPTYKLKIEWHVIFIWCQRCETNGAMRNSRMEENRRMKHARVRTKDDAILDRA